MFLKNWKKEIVTIPNLLSLFRLLLIPVYVSIYLRASNPRDYVIAGMILTLSCLTDAADGYIARKYHMISTLGKLLDPLADKMTQIALTICLSLRFRVLIPVFILLLLKETFQFAGAAILLHRGGQFPSALLPGKISTTVLFVSLIALVLFPNIDSRAVLAISILDSFCLIFAFFTYYFAFWEYIKKSHRAQG